MTNSDIIQSLLQPKPNSSSYFILPVETLGMCTTSLNMILKLLMDIQRKADDSNNAYATIILDTERNIERFLGLFQHRCPQSFVVSTPSMRYGYSYIWISIIKISYLVSKHTYCCFYMAEMKAFSFFMSYLAL